MPISMGLNVGGTFTNTVAYSEKGLQVAKVPTYAGNLPKIMDASIKQLNLNLGDVASLVISFPLAMHPVLAKNGVTSGLLLNKGYMDTLDIQEGRKPYALRAQQDKIYPLIKRRNRREISARLDPDGNELAPLDMNEVTQAVKELVVDRKLKSIAVCFLFSYVNNKHEVAVRDYIKKNYPDVDVCISSEVSPIIGEFRRMSTTALNAYVNPIVRKSIDDLNNYLTKKGLKAPITFLQSSGGVIASDMAKKQVVQLMWSCPAGGVMGVRNLYGKYKDMVTMDFGGTTNDICLIKDGEPPFATESKVIEYLLQFPLIDVQSQGIGGGSIAWVDPWGALNIGPQSSAYEPGPVCFDKGGKDATITDALLALGIFPDSFLGGQLKLNVAKAKQVLGTVAKAYKCTEMEASENIYRLAIDLVYHYIGTKMTEKGYDPRDFTLVAFGGAGGAFAAYVAKELQAKQVLIPPHPGVFSGLGLLTIDLVHEMIRSYLTFVNQADLKRINKTFAELEKEALAILKAEHVKDEDITLTKIAELRYFNQSNITSVTLPQQAKYDSLDLFSHVFHQAHQKIYGHSWEKDPVELVGLKVRGTGKLPTMKLTKIAKAKDDVKRAVTGTRQVTFPIIGKKVASIYDRSLLLAGDKISGPAIIEEVTSTTVVPPDMNAEVDDYGNILIKV